jgi:ATP-dependent DNA helicase RecG
VNDYRNPLVASAMKTLGYVNMFNRGVGQVQTDLKENGNLPAEFNVNLITAFKVEVKVSQSYTNEKGGKTGGKVGGDVPSMSQALSQVLSQACPKLDVSHYPDAIAILIALCKEPQSLKGLMEKTKEKNRGRIKDNVLQHLCESGLVEPTIKDVPNSPKQKYSLTDKGRENLQSIS